MKGEQCLVLQYELQENLFFTLHLLLLFALHIMSHIPSISAHSIVQVTQTELSLILQHLRQGGTDVSAIDRPPADLVLNITATHPTNDGSASHYFLYYPVDEHSKDFFSWLFTIDPAFAQIRRDYCDENGQLVQDFPWAWIAIGCDNALAFAHLSPGYEDLEREIMNAPVNACYQLQPRPDSVASYANATMHGSDNGSDASSDVGGITAWAGVRQAQEVEARGKRYCALEALSPPAYGSGVVQNEERLPSENKRSEVSLSPQILSERSDTLIQSPELEDGGYDSPSSNSYCDSDFDGFERHVDESRWPYKRGDSPATKHKKVRASLNGIVDEIHRGFAADRAKKAAKHQQAHPNTPFSYFDENSGTPTQYMEVHGGSVRYIDAAKAAELQRERPATPALINLDDDGNDSQHLLDAPNDEGGSEWYLDVASLQPAFATVESGLQVYSTGTVFYQPVERDVREEHAPDSEDDNGYMRVSHAHCENRDEAADEWASIPRPALAPLDTATVGQDGQALPYMPEEVSEMALKARADDYAHESYGGYYVSSAGHTPWVSREPITPLVSPYFLADASGVTSPVVISDSENETKEEAFDGSDGTLTLVEESDTTSATSDMDLATTPITPITSFLYNIPATINQTAATTFTPHAEVPAARLNPIQTVASTRYTTSEYWTLARKAKLRRLERAHPHLHRAPGESLLDWFGFLRTYHYGFGRNYDGTYFADTCWDCDEYGHRRRDCRVHPRTLWLRRQRALAARAEAQQRAEEERAHAARVADAFAALDESDQAWFA